MPEPGSPEWLERIAELKAKEQADCPDDEWLYLSFADDDGFRGANIIYARGLIDAVQKSHRLGINPGGEVLCLTLPPDLCPPPLEYIERLLSRADVESLEQHGHGKAIRPGDVLDD